MFRLNAICLSEGLGGILMDTKVPIKKMSSLPLDAFVISAQSFHKQQHCFRCLTGLTGVTRSVIIDEMNGEKTLNALASSCDYQVRKGKLAPFIFLVVGSTLYMYGRSKSTGL